MVLSAFERSPGVGAGMTVTDASGTPIVTSSSIARRAGQHQQRNRLLGGRGPHHRRLDRHHGHGDLQRHDRAGGLNSGTVIAGINYSQSVGSAVGFYNVVSTGRSSVSINGYTNTRTDNGLLVPVEHRRSDLQHRLGRHRPRSASGGDLAAGQRPARHGGHRAPPRLLRSEPRIGPPRPDPKTELS